jgi:DNA polymerase-3 subunit alpha
MMYGEIDRIAKIIPHGSRVTLNDVLEISDMKKTMEEDSRVAHLLKICGDLEGIARNSDTHAAAIVIGPDRLDEFMPLYKTDKGDVSLTTQFTEDAVEDIGLLKINFFGRHNLSVIRNALEIIEENHGERIDFPKMKHDDPRVFDLISSGNTAGIFQLESADMTNLLMRLSPGNIEDIAASIALCQPWKMPFINDYVENKKRPDRIRYIHPLLEPILSNTYGVMVYQEHIMEIFHQLSGYSYGRSDLVRCAMSKKMEDVMQKERDSFINGVTEDGVKTVPGCVANGIPAGVANEIFDQMLRFAEYAFNKSHAAAYAVVAYQTAWLKTYYPAEFMAALMTSVMGKDIAQVGVFVRNSEEMGINVLPPDILDSGMKFTVKDGKIRFGLLGVKNVGAGAVESITSARAAAAAAGRPWSRIVDVIKNVDLNAVNKKAFENLIKSGAFDRFEPNRAKYAAIYEMLIDQVKRERDSVGSGQITMFGGDAAEVMKSADIDLEPPDVGDFTKQEKMLMEKDILGIYLSGHPLDEYAAVIDQISGDENSYVSGKAFVAAGGGTDDPAGEDEGLDQGEGYADSLLKDGMKICFIGIISGKHTSFTKKGDLYARARIEDRYGSADLLVWPEPLEKADGAVENDNIVIVRGKIQLRENSSPTILVSKVTPIDVAESWYAARR